MKNLNILPIYKLLKIICLYYWKLIFIIKNILFYNNKLEKNLLFNIYENRKKLKINFLNFI